MMTRKATNPVQEASEDGFGISGLNSTGDTGDDCRR